MDVGIVMGSGSDLEVMKQSAAALTEFGVSYELVIASAHRHPEKVARYAKAAADAGIKIIIAGAGGAAHLPGVIASMTILPVIGVPVAAAHLNGLDSLYSIIQMPRGVPVATVGIDAAYNAGLLAVHILSLGNERLQEKLAAYRQKLAAKVEEADRQLRGS